MHLEYGKSGGGISKKYREILDLINRDLAVPFGVSDVSALVGMDSNKAKRLLAHLTSQGWLTRIKKGIYITVPLGTLDPKKQGENAWVLANKLFDPCYIGGWSAAEHWHFTEQIFKDVVVFTKRKMRSSNLSVGNTTYKIKTIKQSKFFGTTNAWVNGVKVLVSDPTKTIVDILDDPSIGGGIRHVSDILKNYFDNKDIESNRLIEYINLNGNRTVYKRLGFLLETLKINEPDLINICKKNISSGYSDLDPTVAQNGKMLNRWNLKINVKII